MKKRNVATVKTRNRLWLAATSLSLLLLLSGCVETTKEGVPTGNGWVYNYLVVPTGQLITYFAQHQGLGFGIAIILVTLLVRTLIMPLGIYQSWKSTYQSEKMHYLKPILGPIQERMKAASSQEEQLAAQKEYFATQKEYGVSMFGGLGCLPVLIQMPFFTALLYATRYTPGIAESEFLNISLGKSSLLLTAVAGVLYYFQSLFMQFGLEDEQREQMKKMMLLNPIMIMIFSFSSPAGVTLYWVVGGLIGLFQQAIISFLLKPRIRAKVEEEYRLNPPRPRPQTKDVTPQTDGPLIQSPKTSKRNAGKQRSR